MTDLADVYDDIAADFARRNAAMPETLAALGEELLARLPASPALLDAGCGAGRDLAWFEARGVVACGCDLSAGMLREAAMRVCGPLVQADLRRLPYADASFDAVWCMAVLLHLPKAEAPAALAELHRVLRPGGLLAVTVKAGSGEGLEPAPGWPERFFARYEPSELEGLLRAGGFEPGPVAVNVTPAERWLATIATRAGARPSRGATGSP